MTKENSINKKMILLEYYLALFPCTVFISVANWRKVHRKPSVCAVLQVKVYCDSDLQLF
jgi:hypothetical protein